MAFQMRKSHIFPTYQIIMHDTSDLKCAGLTEKILLVTVLEEFFRKCDIFIPTFWSNASHSAFQLLDNIGLVFFLYNYYMV